jgi:hypothetical protein
MAPLPSISLASVVIGFISFGFTLAIWLHAFVSVHTSYNHPHTRTLHNTGYKIF